MYVVFFLSVYNDEMLSEHKPRLPKTEGRVTHANCALLLETNVVTLATYVSVNLTYLSAAAGHNIFVSVIQNKP